MSIQFSLLFCICIALTIPSLILSTANQELEEINELDRFPESNRRSQQPLHSLTYDGEDNNNDHFVIKKAADIEQILRPCNQIPASGGRHEYANCVRSRMLLMGRRKRRQAS